jgi:hypothetical protein
MKGGRKRGATDLSEEGIKQNRKSGKKMTVREKKKEMKT